jgi:acyl-CoA synthetase (AMP-forming)/AMP-acid ligase II
MYATAKSGDIVYYDLHITARESRSIRNLVFLSPFQTVLRSNAMSRNMSLVAGPESKLLRTITLGALAEAQANLFGDRTALVVSWQNKRFTYRELFDRASTIARALIEMGLQYGDCVGIFAGNCSGYLEVFLGAAFIGCPVVVLNINYTPLELESAVQFSGKSAMQCCLRSARLKVSTRMQAALHC